MSSEREPRTRLDSLFKTLSNVILGLSVFLFVLVVVMNGWEAAARFFFSASSIYTVEISLVLASVVYFVGYAHLLHEDEDVRMAYFVRKLSLRNQRLIDAFNELATVVFFGVLAYGCWGYLTLTSGIPHVLFPFHQGYVALPAMVGAVICLLMSLKRLSAAALKLFEDRAKANVHPASGLRSEP
ncbi:MAG: TRAP transporter small permease subunit [Betaproteobacteria bacterium]|nr:TRAP transporter small permease subunit [Betaproteobacteria bacterium]